MRPLLPPTSMGRPRLDDRTMLNGIVWKFRAGVAWRDVPEECYGWEKALFDHGHCDPGGLPGLRESPDGVTGTPPTKYRKAARHDVSSVTPLTGARQRTMHPQPEVCGEPHAPSGSALAAGLVIAGQRFRRFLRPAGEAAGACQ
ncbi:transposase [Streptomyces flavidovirens]|uniref:transposase n=1 Tax=Streptomyces flavidovirens TaxID=67298 RepID=UPI00341AE41A